MENIDLKRTSSEANLDEPTNEIDPVATLVAEPVTEHASEPAHHYSTRSTVTTASSKQKPIIPRLKPQPYSPADLEKQIKRPLMVEAMSIPLVPIGEAEQDSVDTAFYSTDDHPFNRRGFKYKACRPNPMFKSQFYSTSEIPPHNARWSYLDRAPGLLMDNTATIATAEQGWRSARANVGIREGSWYIEYRILRANQEGTANSTNGMRGLTVADPNKAENRSETPETELPGHVRIGIARREASLEAPVGFDAYSYGLRDKTGQKLHLSRPSEFMRGGFGTGDVIGLLVELPSIDVQRNIAKAQMEQRVTSAPVLSEAKDDGVSPEYDIVRDQIPIRYKGQLYYEQFEYTGTKPMEHLLNPVTVFGEKAIPDKDKFKPATLPDSKIVVFKNGNLVGTAFQDLYSFLPPSSVQNQRFQAKTANSEENDFSGKDDGSLGYYPMVSCFQRGCCQINTSSELTFVPEELKERLEKGEVKLLSERYTETVVEEYVWDIVEEVENDFLDQLEAE
ncbi:unnamed protein product [Kuraishia capsulata CBS 1993]|uniref:B30.2/SPRY domain-containing protein n=1 Tax=Kuraishia capsulata CBS 1993 TaxID=1382522 RepID=W6MWE0_9ASCO|nr:uncharacterized protein KUCA_T00003258001 [Kuraishia capsulata CBS 1993]CDK27280.1 unnamed protein product [Kuraishia capsulata CBS 1993]